MIEKVQFRNFKAYRSLDLDLEPFTVLVGPNASGKTTLLEGLRLISDHAASAFIDPYDADWADPKLRSFGVSRPIELTLSGRWNKTPGLLRYVGHEPEIDGLDHPVSGQWGELNFGLGQVEGSAKPIGESESLFDFGLKLLATEVLRFELMRLAEASYSEAEIPRVEGNGSGLASVLAYLKLSHDETFSEIELSLKRIVPSVRRIRIERAMVEQNSLRTIALDEQKALVPEKRTLWGNRIVLDMQGAKGVPANAAGEGTLMVLGLLTVLMGPQKPRLVLLDDIELALHPTAQERLIAALRVIQAKDPELQIVATSHSPFILNYLKPEEVRMTFLTENGFARCEKLTAHPEFEKWKELMSPGEFWSTVGESWIGKVSASASHE
ncbi:AAA family ATPase [Corallococcus aberystwythensis]|uniref:AAA family ATPase n=1 Tax=Corallococcus aberystwythensis TaxID=2316722 RepID=UPI00131506A5|nr:ATP-binding protein [Corallococcus aberystwythensis]